VFLVLLLALFLHFLLERGLLDDLDLLPGMLTHEKLHLFLDFGGNDDRLEVLLFVFLLVLLSFPINDLAEHELDRLLGYVSSYIDNLALFQALLRTE
jgi:hypothetical protein